MCEAVITGGGALGCKPCSIDDCKTETNCLLGSTMDACNCCTKCFRLNGQTCGGIGYVVGRCGAGLRCNLAYATFKNPVGYCVPVLTTTAAPLHQSLLTTRALFVGAGMQNAGNFGQESAVARQKIPGLPKKQVVSNEEREAQKLSENNPKYFVYPSGVWNMDSLKLLDDHGPSKSKVDAFSQNDTVTQNSPEKHSNEQRRQKILNKDSVEDNISEVSPAVIFVAISGAVFFCLVALLLLPQNSSDSPN
ncbi:uncharacterized protein [Montipora capricornis]|uniref:uncharacterized protein n=1 Tax=Montipora capricornis TaxID=246305 RepID=UPI0035F1D0E6